MLRDFLFLSLKNLKYRPTRSWLTVIGIMIGISVVIAVFFLGAGMRNTVSNLLNRFGRDLIFVIPGELTDPFSSIVGKERIRAKDIKVIKEVKGVEMVLPTVESKLVTGEFLGEKKLISFHAQPWKEMKRVFEESQGYRLEFGRWPENDFSREIILGNKFAHEKFKTSVNIGDDLVVRGKRLKVAGIFAELGEQNHDNAVFISVRMLEELTGEKFDYMTAIVKVEPAFGLDEVAENIRYELARQKSIGDFSVLTSEKAGAIAGDIIGMIEFALAAIAGVALVVGGVGIMNAMYTSVLERTPEIGTMKAVGARNGSILLIFLLESGLIGSFGGIAGALLGVGLAKLVEFFAYQKGFPFLTIVISFQTIFLVVLFAFAVGVISGLLPARAAARLKPVEALRYE